MAETVFTVLPSDVTTFTLTGGPYTDTGGVSDFAGMTGTIVPVDGTSRKPISLIHSSSGAVIKPTPVTVTIGSGGTWSITGLPVSDEPTLTPVGFLYTVVWAVPPWAPSPGDKAIYVPGSLAGTIDYDLLTESPDVTTVYIPVYAQADADAAAAAASAAAAAASAAAAATVFDDYGDGVVVTASTTVTDNGDGTAIV